MFFSVNKRSAVLERCSCYVPLASAALLICSQLFQPFRECSLMFFSVSECSAVLERCSCYVPLASAALLNCSQLFQPFRECSLTVLLCERMFRSTGTLFLLCSSCFCCTPDLLTTIPAVPRVFSDSSSLRANVPQ